MLMKRRIAMVFPIALLIAATGLGQERDRKVREDRKSFQTNNSWVYNDLSKAFEQARRSKKPILAVLRCVP